MKKSFLLILIFISFSLAGQDLQQLEGVLDFSINLKELNNEKILKKLILENKYLVLEGAVSAINIIENSKSSFKVEVDFVNGEWNGFENVSMYKCKLMFFDKKFSRSFPKRPPRKPDPKYIPLNSHLLVLAKIIEIQGNVTYLECIKYRLIP